jgi:hypothetical protein
MFSDPEDAYRLSEKYADEQADKAMAMVAPNGDEEDLSGNA